MRSTTRVQQTLTVMVSTQKILYRISISLPAEISSPTLCLGLGFTESGQRLRIHNEGINLHLLLKFYEDFIIN